LSGIGREDGLEDGTAALATGAAKEGHGAAVVAGFLGWTLDAFDFFLVAFSLTAIAQEFHRSRSRWCFVQWERLFLGRWPIATGGGFR
jgi:hypothetical protein